MQKSFGNSWSRIEFLCIFLAVVAPQCVLSLSSNRIVTDDFNRIVSVIELDERNILERDVITYQQQQLKTRDQPEVAKDIRTLEIKSVGFDDNSPAYLYVTPFKDSCRKNASFLPSWKIDNGTSNGVFRIKINYEQRLTEGDLFFCVSDDDEGHHLGDSSSFRLR
jgi:hypothetical protein